MTTRRDVQSPHQRVAILGLGLMGTSLGWALREAGLAESVAGYDAAPGVAARAQERGAITLACGSVAEAVSGADLVVLAVPVLAMRPLFAEIGPHLAPGTLVTDLGSTKGEVVAWATALLPATARYVGGHPMAGRESSGVEAATPTLYQGCAWCLTPTPETSPTALEELAELVSGLGARPQVLAAEAHDAAVAAISHLPLLAAVALTNAVSRRTDWDVAQRLAAGGFLDTTRVAAGDARTARDICLTNAEPLVDALDGYIAELRALRAQIVARDPAIEASFQRAREVRRAWPPGILSDAEEVNAAPRRQE